MVFSRLVFVPVRIAIACRVLFTSPRATAQAFDAAYVSAILAMHDALIRVGKWALGDEWNGVDERPPFGTGTRLYWRSGDGEDVSATVNKGIVRIEGTDMEFPSVQTFFTHIGSGTLVRVDGAQAKGGPAIASRIAEYYGTMEPNGMLKVN